MIFEKTFLQVDDSLVRIIIKGYAVPGESWMRTELEVLIENPDDKCFYPPVTMGHSAYGKLKKLDKEQAGQLQIFYSGITVGQINQALAEFEQIKKSSAAF